MSALVAPRPRALYLPDGSAPDDFDHLAADDFAGGFACGECAEHRDKAERLQLQLAKAHALLKLLRRMEPKPAKSEGLDDDPAELAAIGQAVAFATLRTRIDLYFAAVRA